MNGPPTAKTGFALPIALFTLAVLGGLLASVFFLGRATYQSGVNALAFHKAQAAAEAGAYETFARLDAPTLVHLALDSTVAIQAGPSRATVTRTGVNTFFLQNAAHQGGVVRRVGLLASIEPGPTALRQALSAGGRVAVAAGAGVWEPANPLVAPCGATPSSPEYTMRTDFSPLGWDLAARWKTRATVVLSGGSVVQPGPTYSSRTCNAADYRNWGEPQGSGSCQAHLPVIHVTGDLTLVGGVGQGVLVVEGDLRLQGNAQFAGLVLIEGRLLMAGSARLEGAVQVSDSQQIGSTLRDRASIVFSPCALVRALLLEGRPRLLPTRSWIQLY